MLTVIFYSSAIFKDSISRGYYFEELVSAINTGIVYVIEQ